MRQVAQSVGQAADGLAKRRYRAIVEVRRGHHDISETRHPEDVEITLLVGDVKSPFVRIRTACRLPVVLQESELAVQPASDAHPVVARRAPHLNELVQAGLLRARESPVVAGEKRIEA